MKVTKETARQLAALQESLHTETLEETIRFLLRTHREQLVSEAFGADKGRVRSFTEKDRGEDHS